MVRRVLVLSDVSLGFAVPQIHLLARSLADEFQAETLIVEPDMKGRRDLVEVDGVQIHRISTRMPPHDMMFCIEYAQAARRIYRSFAPDVLVTLNAGVLPPLLLEARRPAAVVYYMLESLDHQMVHGGRLFYDINRMAAPFIDLILVPEHRRFLLDKARLGWPDIPVVEVLNVSPEPKPGTSVTRAGRRFLYAGTLSRESGIDFLLDDRLAGIDIDMAGPVDLPDARKFVERFVGKSGEAQKRYLGLLPHCQILEMLPSYTYRLVMWKADNVNTYYASPNKFFESIAHGVPPVCTPSPQICDIIRKYQCALLSDDWGVASFCHAMWDAMMIAGTPTYDNLVANCARAREAEINWPHQFDKVRAALAAVLGGRGGGRPSTPAGLQPDPAEDARPAPPIGRCALQAANGGP